MPDDSKSVENPVAYEQPDGERPASASPTETTLEAESTTAGHDPYAALRYRDYRVFSIAWMVSVIGNQMTAAALGWELFDRTRNELNLGWIGGVQAIPLLLLALPAGALADYVDRRRIMTVTSTLAAITSIGFAVMSYSTHPHYLWIMYGLLLLNSTFMVLGRPARSSFLPTIVPPKIFSNAVTWNASFYQTATVVGPALAGLVITYSLRHFNNVRPIYVVDAVCALIFAGTMFILPPPRYGDFEKRASSEDSAFERLTAGLHFVWRTKIVLATLTLDLFAVLLGGAVYLLPVFAKEILNVGSWGFGWLRAADAMGAITCAILIAHTPPMKKAGRAMLLAVGAFGLATIGFGLSRNFFLSFLMVFLIGAFDNISVVVRHTLVQVLTPDAMRGRVSAVNNIFIGASNELGGLESGVTARLFGQLALGMGWASTVQDSKVWGATTSVVSGGIGTIIVVIALAIAFPAVRKFGRLDQARPAN
ncbi:MAG TPA: MFS transporter [Tepidisphaeraceae bacterium]|jgi:MFS family permease